MNTWSRCVAGVVVVSGIFGGLSGAGAETCTLELKRLESPGSNGRGLYTGVYPQCYRMRIGSAEEAYHAETFSKIVKKEPARYESEHPFRGVATFGSRPFGFVFDWTYGKAAGYGRLYFDLNRNGDLTDDKVLDGKRPATRHPAGYSVYEFPRVDLTVDVDGTEADYAFFPRSTYTESPTAEYRQVVAMFQAAAHREGSITLRGKPRRIVLLDRNSNGRFDDRTEIRGEVKIHHGLLAHTVGDMLLLDPQPNNLDSSYGYGAANAGNGSTCRSWPSSMDAATTWRFRPPATSSRSCLVRCRWAT